MPIRAGDFLTLSKITAKGLPFLHDLLLLQEELPLQLRQAVVVLLLSGGECKPALLADFLLQRAFLHMLFQVLTKNFGDDFEPLLVKGARLHQLTAVVRAAVLLEEAAGAMLHG